MRKYLFYAIFLAFCPLLFAQQPLNNDSITKMVKAGLTEDLIITTINASPGTYDTSVEAIIALKSAGVSDKVVGAIVTKANAPVAPPVNTPANPALTVAPANGNALPPGIDDVGVYYKDRSGAWQSVMPEIVNFKTGGVLKSMVTDGLVKGDLNGHIHGAHAALDVTFPVVLCVYVPEGTAITEYQLLRLRENGSSREFRSVTGGIVHVTGGATRDLVEYKAEKIATRLYQFTIDSSFKKGEYGLLPPGSYGSSNLGSNGKIYSFSIKE